MANNSENLSPLFSVITPVYNRADCIGRCLESVASQKGDVAFEHIVVDDGSTDSTFGIVDGFASSHPNVKALKLPQNRGTNAARNAAVKAASGRFVMLLDSDDMLVDGALQMAAEQVKLYPEISHFMFTVDDRIDEFKNAGIAPGQIIDYTFNDFLEGRVTGDFAHFVLRDTMLRFPYDEKLRIFESIFFLSYFREAGTVRFINRLTSARDRDRDDRVTFTLIPDNKATLRATVQSIDLLCERFGDDLRLTPARRSRLAEELLKKHRFETMLGERDAAFETERRLADIGVTAPLAWRTLNKLNLGSSFFAVARHYVKLKTALGIRPC